LRAAGIYRCQDRDHAAARLYHWTVYCIDSGVAEIARLARAITTWREEFLAFFSAGRVSNGPTEAVNLLIKKQEFRSRIPKPTTGYAHFCAAESPGTIKPQYHRGADYHAWLRRATLLWTTIPFRERQQRLRSSVRVSPS